MKDYLLKTFHGSPKKKKEYKAWNMSGILTVQDTFVSAIN